VRTESNLYQTKNGVSCQFRAFLTLVGKTMGC
jgi:hypothetical protein